MSGNNNLSSETAWAHVQEIWNKNPDLITLEHSKIFGSAVGCFTVSPSGTHLAAGFKDHLDGGGNIGGLYIIDLATGMVVASRMCPYGVTFGLTDDDNTLLWTPDSQYVIVSTNQNNILVLHASSLSTRSTEPSANGSDGDALLDPVSWCSSFGCSDAVLFTLSPCGHFIFAKSAMDCTKSERRGATSNADGNTGDVDDGNASLREMYILPLRAEDIQQARDLNSKLTEGILDTLRYVAADALWVYLPGQDREKHPLGSYVILGTEMVSVINPQTGETVWSCPTLGKNGCVRLDTASPSRHFLTLHAVTQPNVEDPASLSSELRAELESLQTDLAAAQAIIAEEEKKAEEKKKEEEEEKARLAAEAAAAAAERGNGDGDGDGDGEGDPGLPVGFSSFPGGPGSFGFGGFGGFASMSVAHRQADFKKSAIQTKISELGKEVFAEVRRLSADALSNTSRSLPAPIFQAPVPTKPPSPDAYHRFDTSARVVWSPNDQYFAVYHSIAIDVYRVMDSSAVQVVSLPWEAPEVEVAGDTKKSLPWFIRSRDTSNFSFGMVADADEAQGSEESVLCVRCSTATVYLSLLDGNGLTEIGSFDSRLAKQHNRTGPNRDLVHVGARIIGVQRSGHGGGLRVRIAVIGQTGFELYSVQVGDLNQGGSATEVDMSVSLVRSYITEIPHLGHPDPGTAMHPLVSWHPDQFRATGEYVESIVQDIEDPLWTRALCGAFSITDDLFRSDVPLRWVGVDQRARSLYLPPGVTIADVENELALVISPHAVRGEHLPRAVPVSWVSNQVSSVEGMLPTQVAADVTDSYTKIRSFLGADNTGSSLQEKRKKETRPGFYDEPSKGTFFTRPPAMYCPDTPFVTRAFLDSAHPQTQQEVDALNGSIVDEITMDMIEPWVGKQVMILNNMDNVDRGTLSAVVPVTEGVAGDMYALSTVSEWGSGESRSCISQLKWIGLLKVRELPVHG